MSKKEKHTIPGKGMSGPAGPSKQALKDADDFFSKHKQAPRRAQEPFTPKMRQATGVLGWILLLVIGGGCLLAFVAGTLTS